MRRRFAFSWAASIALSGCGSCAWFPLLPDKRTPVDRAHELTDLCKEDSPASAPDALSPAIVERVEPAYVHMNAGAGGDLRLRGANLHMRPTVNMPIGVLQRALECHQARVTLGEAKEVDDDPYVLAGSWVDIHVSGTEEGLVAAVLTDSLDDARRIVDRAHKFVTSPRPPPAPPP
jgi:hypothetical protein